MHTTIEITRIVSPALNQTDRKTEKTLKRSITSTIAEPSNGS